MNLRKVVRLVGSADMTTRDVEAFLKKTAIAYHPIWPFCVDLGGMQ